MLGCLLIARFTLCASRELAKAIHPLHVLSPKSNRQKRDRHAKFSRDAMMQD
jgi:hypothetical protein